MATISQAQLDRINAERRRKGKREISMHQARSAAANRSDNDIDNFLIMYMIASDDGGGRSSSSSYDPPSSSSSSDSSFSSDSGGGFDGGGGGFD